MYLLKTGAVAMVGDRSLRCWLKPKLKQRCALGLDVLSQPSSRLFPRKIKTKFQFCARFRAVGLSQTDDRLLGQVLPSNRRLLLKKCSARSWHNKRQVLLESLWWSRSFPFHSFEAFPTVEQHFLVPFVVVQEYVRAWSKSSSASPLFFSPGAPVFRFDTVGSGRWTSLTMQDMEKSVV